jgi:hypothetical protein
MAAGYFWGITWHNTHNPKYELSMKSLIYSILPYWVISSIRRRRDIKRRYKLAVRDNGRIYGTYLDPL